MRTLLNIGGWFPMKEDVAAYEWSKHYMLPSSFIYAVKELEVSELVVTALQSHVGPLFNPVDVVAVYHTGVNSKMTLPFFVKEIDAKRLKPLTIKTVF